MVKHIKINDSPQSAQLLASVHKIVRVLRCLMKNMHKSTLLYSLNPSVLRDLPDGKYHVHVHGVHKDAESSRPLKFLINYSEDKYNFNGSRNFGWFEEASTLTVHVGLILRDGLKFFEMGANSLKPLVHKVIMCTAKKFSKSVFPYLNSRKWGDYHFVNRHVRM